MKTKKPKNIVWQFPPEGTVKSHRVKTGDNWWKLAAQYGFADPWTIIEFNYRTRVPEEVNWYLERLVGCTKSNDGINYSFDSSDSFGMIYIPPKDWKGFKSEPLEILAAVASTALFDILGYEVPFVDAMNINYTWDRAVFAVADENLPVPAEYNYNNILFLRVPKTPGRVGTFDRLMLAKEACHFAYGKHARNVPFSSYTEAVSLVCGRGFHLSIPEWRKLPYSPVQFIRSTRPQEVYAALDKVLNDHGKNPASVDLKPVMRIVEREPFFMQRLHGYWPRGAARAA